MALNKTARTNLMYIGIVIGILMLLPFFNDLVEEYRRRRSRRNREREATVMRGTGVNESARSKARRRSKIASFRSS